MKYASCHSFISGAGSSLLPFCSSNHAVGIAVFGILFCAGCDSGPKGPPRVETVPVTGVVLIDGQPQERVAVRAVPVQGETPTATTPSAFTNAEGGFSLSTYESGDGVPVGEYKLTFQWGQINLLSGRYGGDKFEGKYDNPDKSEYQITVTEGSEPIDLGTIELTTR